MEKAYPRQCQAVSSSIQELELIEKDRDSNPDQAINCSGRMLSELFVWKEDFWSNSLRTFGYELGRFIYLMDAYEDIEKDAVSGNYNPFMTIKDHENFDSECQNMLMMQMAECCRAFERLPIVQDAGILRNILYSGVWAKFASVYNKRNKAGENE